MDQALIAVLGGLVGSILTTAISRVCDLIQKKKEHDYSLRKIYFEKKMNATEAAISQRYLLSSCLKSLSCFFTEISKNLPLVISTPPDFLKSFLESVSNQLKKTTDPVFDAANAILLYFDLDKFENSALAKEAMDLMMSIGWQSSFLPLLIEKYSKATNVTEQEETLRAVRNLFSKMQSDVAALSEKTERGAQEVRAAITEIRSQMQKYDS